MGDKLSLRVDVPLIISAPKSGEYGKDQGADILNDLFGKVNEQKFNSCFLIQAGSVVSVGLFRIWAS